MVQPIRGAFVAGLAILLAGCATTSFPGESRASARIVINNEHSPVERTIHLVPSLGNTKRLGRVQHNDSDSFDIPERVGGTYRLWSRTSGDRGFYSPEFTLEDGYVVEWDMRLNRVIRIGTLLDVS